MIAISQTGSTALFLLQQSQRQDSRNGNALGFLRSGLFSAVGAGDSMGARVLDAFAENTNLQRQFAAEYDRALKENPGITAANAGHLAIHEVITKNRSSFPSGGFTIHTTLPGGGSITTLIQPTDGPRLSFRGSESVAIKMAAAEAAKADLEMADTALEVRDARDQAQAIRDRISALFS